MPLLPLLLLIFLGSQGCNKSNLATPPPVSVPIQGSVFDSTTHTPVPFAIVELGSHAVKTSSNGTYSFPYSLVQSGTYLMEVLASGYQTASEQVKVIPDTTQTMDFYVQAVQETTFVNSTIDPNSYSMQKFSFDSYSFVQCSNGILSHDVKVTIQLDTVTNPVHITVVSPDGSYKLDQMVTGANFTQEFMSNLCGGWAMVVYDSGAAQTAYSGEIIMDFSSYPPTSDSLSTSIMVPFNYPSIASDSSASFSRILVADMNYQLRLNISGNSDDNIYLIIYDPESNILFDRLVSGNYVSQSFAAARDGFYTFKFSNEFPVASSRRYNQSSVASSKSVSGVLAINP